MDPDRGLFSRILPVPKNGGFRMDGYWVWCGSVIRGEDGLYHMFASRWPTNLPMFSGYVLNSEIVRAVSVAPEGPYQFADRVLPDSPPEAWDGRMAHNPTVHRCGDKFLLFYIGSTFAGPLEQDDPDEAGEQVKQSYAGIRIGLAISSSVKGPWKILSKPILEPRPNHWDANIVTNPAPCVREDGSIILYYRSNTPDGLRIGVAGADFYEGPYRRLSEDPVLRFEGGDYVEDPYVWWAGNHYQMLAKDMLGGITGEYHAGAHFHSSDGLLWEPMKPAKAYSRNITWTDGSTEKLGSLERPQLLFDEEGEPICLFVAAADGPGGFRNANNTWNLAIPFQRPTQANTPANRT
ncbi:glycoside hydrolase family protein [Puniceicoccus vermicola]|uniref:Glycosyl hydrolase family 43 n=1 Tax=Puniceicoccus vermicola TaxID=388746 RepID=A0A7X1E4M9_9BACT|nr:glycoside hydrolase family protein [Puniceicoccus vermicola]MBC2602705.1 glycosyl hydrolase family 43 [Puniceicoccus vermicola]